MGKCNILNSVISEGCVENVFAIISNFLFIRNMTMEQRLWCRHYL